MARRTASTALSRLAAASAAVFAACAPAAADDGYSLLPRCTATEQADRDCLAQMATSLYSNIADQQKAQALYDRHIGALTLADPYAAIQISYRLMLHPQADDEFYVRAVQHFSEAMTALYRKGDVALETSLGIEAMVEHTGTNWTTRQGKRTETWFGLLDSLKAIDTVAAIRIAVKFARPEYAKNFTKDQRAEVLKRFTAYLADYAGNTHDSEVNYLKPISPRAQKLDAFKPFMYDAWAADPAVNPFSRAMFDAITVMTDRIAQKTPDEAAYAIADFFMDTNHPRMNDALIASMRRYFEMTRAQISLSGTIRALYRTADMLDSYSTIDPLITTPRDVTYEFLMDAYQEARRDSPGEQELRDMLHVTNKIKVYFEMNKEGSALHVRATTLHEELQQDLRGSSSPKAPAPLY